MIRATPTDASKTAIDISETIVTMVELTPPDDVPEGVPSKNHDACAERELHHTAVAMVIAAMEPATTTAKVPSIRRVRRDRLSRTTTAMAVAVHETSARATNTAHAVTAHEYALSAPFRCISLRVCAHCDKGITVATASPLAITERSVCRRT